MHNDRVSANTLHGAISVMDVDVYDRLGRLADDLNFRWGGRPCVAKLMRAVSRIDPIALEEALQDCEEESAGEGDSDE